MNDSLKIVWRVVKNKYVIATVVFLLIFLFFDENSFLLTRSLSRDIKQLKVQEATLRKEMVADSIENERLKHDLRAIERYGRENYYMKAQDEDIYIITTKK